MELVPRPYTQYLNGYYDPAQPVCSLGDWQVFISEFQNTYFLVLVNAVTESMFEGKFRDRLERDQHADLLKSIPPEGGTGTGVPAKLSPLTPLLSSSNAKPFPQDKKPPHPEA